MTLAWLTRVNVEPAMLGVCVNNAHATNQAIRKHGQFSINIPTVDMVEVADYCGITSAKKTDKSGLFEVFYGNLKHAPLIAACPLNIECKLVQTVDLPTNTFFIGEIEKVHCDQECLSNGKPDARKIKSFLLTMPDNQYWALAEPIGQAWKVGMKYRDRTQSK